MADPADNVVPFQPEPSGMDFIVQQRQQAQAGAITSLDDSADDAARANDLSDATGTPPALVYGDLENFEKQHKAALTSQLLQNNGYLRDYVNSHPLAAKISNDDWGNMDSFSQAVSKFQGSRAGQILNAPTSTLAAAAQGFKEGFGSAQPGQWAPTDENTNRLAWSLLTGVGAPIEFASKLFSGALGAIQAGSEQAQTALGVSPNAASRNSQEIAALAEAYFGGLTGQHGVGEPALSIGEQHIEAARLAKPFVDNGEVPPIGLHPEIDALHQEQSKADAKALNDALSEATATATRERAPDLFADFAKQHVGDTQIGISADAVRKLYGDKPPASDDGLLGWIPDLQTKLSTAEAVGGDVQVPLSEYLARIEPEVHKEIEEGIRVRPEGYTPQEIKDGIEAYHGSPYQFDAFDSQHIGSGEGAQSYGYGHYVAEAPGVAQEYANMADRMADYNETMSGEKSDIKPNMYRVKVLRHPDEFLDYDTPLEKQKIDYEKVNEAVAPNQPALPDMTGAELMDALRNMGKNPKQASELLEKAGIPGIKYLDQGSRFNDDRTSLEELKKKYDELGAEDQSAQIQNKLDKIDNKTRNYVVFNDKDLQMLDRNGQALNAVRQQGSLEPKSLGAAVTPPGDRELPKEPFAGAAPGLTKAQTERYVRKIEQRQEEDQEKAQARAVEAQRKRLSPQWNEDRKGVRNEMVAQVQGEPAWNLNERLLAGNKIDPSGLSDEEKAALPRDYIGKGGLHVDDLEAQYGTDGHVLVAQLSAIEAARKESGLRGMDFRRQYIERLTDAEMEHRYGDFSKKVLDEARDQALSQTQEEMLHEQTMKLAAEAGAEYPIKAGQIRSALEDEFGESTMGSAKRDAYLNAAGRAGRAMEDAHLKGDVGEAFRQSQRQQLAFILAREAHGLEKERAKFEKLTKALGERSNDRIDQEYMNQAHGLMTRVGLRVKRSVQDLQDSLAQDPHNNLRDFVEHKEVHDLRALPVADFLKDPNWKADGVDGLSVNEFRDLHDALATLDHNGRDEKKIIAQGNAADLAETKGNLIESLDRFKDKAFDPETGKRIEFAHKPRQFLRNGVVAHLGMETLLDNIDHYDPRGPWNKYVYRPLIEGANSEDALVRETASKLRAIRDNGDLKEKVGPSPFIDPQTKQPVNLTRGGLRSVILNMGNDSNFHKLAGGWFNPSEMAKADKATWRAELTQFKQQITDYTHSVSTKEDWDWVQKIWDTLSDLGDRSDRMYRQLSGVAPQRLKVNPIDTPHGQYDGGYYPLMRHEIYGQDENLRKGDLMGEGFYRSMTAEGYTKQRTGALYPLALNLDQLPNTIAQVIHNVSLRPAAVEVGKLVYDNGLKMALKTKLGEEYANMFQPWLKDIVNPRNFSNDPNKQALFNMLDSLRANVQVSLIGLNPSTPLKHGPTAMVSSLAELGPGGAKEFVTALRSLYAVNDETGLTNVNFAKSKSEEMQRRFQSWVETLTGSHQELLNGKGTWKQYQAWMSEMATKPVAYSDMLSSTSMWLAKYKMEMQDHGIEGDAVYAADKSVRRAHGSTADPSRPSIMRSPALRPFVGFMTFMNDLLNRNIDTVWRAGEVMGMAKGGQKAQAMAQVPGLVGRVLAYTIAPAVIEEMVTGSTNDEHEGWGVKSAKAIGHTLSAGVIGIRDIADAIVNARDPSVGLINTMYKTATDPFRDFEAKNVKPVNVIKHAAALGGTLTGVPLQFGRSAAFGYGVAKGTERPKGPWGWLTGLRYGTLQHHAPTMEKWWEGKSN